MSILVSFARSAQLASSLARNGARCLQTSFPRLQSEEDLMSQIKADLKDAMRAKDSFKSTVLRGLMSDYQYAGKSGNASVNLSTILQKAVSKRQESARQFRAAKPAREDLAEKEDKEASMIQSLLPKQIPIDQLESIVREVISEVQKSGGQGKKMMGDVMKGVAAKVDKIRAPGSLISDVVRRLLPKD